MKIDVSNLPPDLTEPPPGAKGNYAFQPSTGKIWRKLNGEWLPIADARKRIKARTLT